MKVIFLFWIVFSGLAQAQSFSKYDVCKEEGELCNSSQQCCGALSCVSATTTQGRCGAGGASCVGGGESCSFSTDCCGSLICGIEGTCK